MTSRWIWAPALFLLAVLPGGSVHAEPGAPLATPETAPAETERTPPAETAAPDAAAPAAPIDPAAAARSVEPLAPEDPVSAEDAKAQRGGFRGWWKAERTTPPAPASADTWVRGTCVDCSVPFTGDRFRTRGPAAWFRRTAADWLAMPATVTTWGAPGWLTFGAFTAATVVPMLPLDPSLDVRVQDWIGERRNPKADKAFVRITTKEIVSGTIVFEALILGAGWSSGNERLLEYGSLTVEAIADVQFYHILSKLLLGREGPGDGDGQGKVHGPTKFFFPSGTPSGHTATVYAVLTVSAEYADSWVLRAFSHLASLYFGASLIYRGAHFFSDVIWGAAMGYFMGRWVMRYRSSRYRCDDPRKLSLRERIKWTPVVSQHGVALGASLAL